MKRLTVLIVLIFVATLSGCVKRTEDSTDLRIINEDITEMKEAIDLLQQTNIELEAELAADSEQVWEYIRTILYEMVTQEELYEVTEDFNTALDAYNVFLHSEDFYDFVQLATINIRIMEYEHQDPSTMTLIDTMTYQDLLVLQDALYYELITRGGK